ncbi:MAG: hypothetical protein VR70_04965 [Rhodospirillaceae bacterium BRH_c57]|nr:MAG: hypothetical protein VR70_04965 [Rhodospirillaceae bacterium BRH_c57]
MSLLRSSLLFLLIAVAPVQTPALAREYRQVIEDVTLDRTLRLEGPEWNDTLVRRVTLRGIDGDGIFLKNVANVRIEDSIIEDVTVSGIRLSAEGGTTDVHMINNQIARTGRDGIAAAQRQGAGVDHPGLVVEGNSIDSAGLTGNRGLYHGIYVQSTDFVITHNRVTNTVDGNGISVRSSGTVRGNMVKGTGKSGIAYYADHMRGPSNRLVIEGNTVGDVAQGWQRRYAVDLLRIPDDANVVGEFIIRGNTIIGQHTPAIRVHSDYGRLGIRPHIAGNQRKNVGDIVGVRQ